MFKIQAEQDGKPVNMKKFLGRDGNEFTDSELADAVVEHLQKLQKRFRVEQTAGGYAVVGEISSFEKTEEGPKETVHKLPMRSELEPSVFADEAVASQHAARLNAHYAGPEFSVVEVPDPPVGNE